MDRSKSASRGQKLKIGNAHVGSELYALGTKNSRDDSKSKIFALKGSSSSSNDRKRDASSSHCSSNKKPKSHFASNLPIVLDESISLRNSAMENTWEQKATEVDVLEHILCTYLHVDKKDSVSISDLCGKIKLLIQTYIRSKTDDTLSIFLIYLAKVRPELFCHESVLNGLISTLRRDTTYTYKGKGNPHLQILASNTFFRVYNDKHHWPEIFIRSYIDDAINERFWVDNELCAPFTKNLCAVFGTRSPSKGILLGDITLNSNSAPNNPDTIKMDEHSEDKLPYESDINTTAKICFGSLNVRWTVKNRYATSFNNVETYIIDAIKEQLNRRQSQECYTRNFLKFLCSTSGLVEVRCLAITRLELWIHNAKLIKSAQELLFYICSNITCVSFKDQEVLASLVKMRLKTKPLINLYMICLKEVIMLHSTILPIILKLVLQNELSNARNPNNMGILATLFQTDPIHSARSLADIYKEFLLQREDCLRTLRVFLRELVRMLRFEINIVEFCRVFLNGRSELTSQIQNSEYRDRIFHSMVDISCLCMLLAVSPQVRDAYGSLRNGLDIKSSNVLLKFYQQISQIQLDAVSWMYAIVPNVYKLQGLDFGPALHKLLLLESPEQYSRCDQWPSEPERSTLLKIVSETPIYEDSLLRIILIGITQDIPLSIPETFEVLVSVLKRASTLRSSDMPAVIANKFEIIDFLFSMAEYHYPEKIKLPSDYNPPKLAITILYWKAWIIMLMISAHNPSTFGAFCWDHYPTMKMLMEMCITNDSKDYKAAKDELQITTLEREQILELETYLAAHTFSDAITEDNAVLISQVMLMDPMGPARRAPFLILEQLKHLNKSLRLGHLLCRSRKPDLLLEIIHRQGTSQSMPWLSDLVQNSDGEFRYLPVQCLCEFLMSNVTILSEENSRDANLLNYLRKLISEESADKQSVFEMLDYLFRRLSSTVKQSRISASAGLKLLFNADESWLLFSLPQIPYFKDVRPFIITQVRSACQVENVPELVMAYIQFIAAHTQSDSVSIMLDHVIDLAQLIVERNTMFQNISSIYFKQKEGTPQIENDRIDRSQQTLKCIFVMFNNFIIKLRENQEPYEWTQYPDLLMVNFEDGVQLPMHLNIIHAFVILLTHANISIPESIPILDYWFPLGRPTACAYFPEVPNEQVQLLPDWLKLKMIRSSIDRLIGAAICDLSPDQIVLFVQNFGTPVNSMSKLLALLDHAVIEQFEAVKNAILNRAYLAQLIEIQQARGAKNGHVTVQALELHSHSKMVPDLHKLEVDKVECVHYFEDLSSNFKQHISNNIHADIEIVIDNILKASFVNKVNIFKFRKLIHGIMKRYGKSVKSREDCQMYSIHRISTLFINRMDTSVSLSLFRNMFKKHTCTFFRSLFKNGPKIIEPRSLIYNVLDKVFINCSQMTEKNSKRLLPLFQNEMIFKGKQQSIDYQLSDKKVSQHTLFNVLGLRKNGQNTKIAEQYITKLFIDNIITSLKNSYNCLLNDHFNGQEYIHQGVLIDWLVKEDPELIVVNKSIQIDLMFSTTYREFRFHLLSLLCHETNWDTLNEVVNYLLEKFRPEYNYNIILNFIEAFLRNPRLCKGRDKAISKNFRPHITFILTQKKVTVLTRYILFESELDIYPEDMGYCDRLYSRIDLLCRVSNNKASIFINSIVNALSHPCPALLRYKFIQQLYIMHPKIIFFRKEFSDLFKVKIHNLNGFKSDKVANFLITCLGNLFSKKDFESIFSDTELLLRKLAASHPALFLRQLGAFCSQIQGKAHISIRTLRDEHHIQRFIQILRSLEVLQPMVFNDSYKLSLQECFDCYFTYFKYHIREKETYQIVLKFVELLHAYIKTNPSSAFNYVEKYTVMLQELAAKFNFLITLQQLVQGLSLRKHKSIIFSPLRGEDTKYEFDIDENLDYKTLPNVNVSLENEITLDTNISLQIEVDSKIATSLAFPEPQKQTLKVSSNIISLIQIIKRSSIEEVILSPLQEIESLTSKRFSYLHELFDRLLDLIFSPSAQVRSIAFILLIRHLKSQPGRSDVIRCTLNAFLQCLCDENSSVASTAVDNLVEMTVLLQEHTVEILGVAFALGIKSKSSTGTYIKRTIQTLMLQQGF